MGNLSPKAAFIGRISGSPVTPDGPAPDLDDHPEPGGVDLDEAPDEIEDDGGADEAVTDGSDVDGVVASSSTASTSDPTPLRPPTQLYPKAEQAPAAPKPFDPDSFRNEMRDILRQEMQALLAEQAKAAKPPEPQKSWLEELYPNEDDRPDFPPEVVDYFQKMRDDLQGVRSGQESLHHQIAVREQVELLGREFREVVDSGEFNHIDREMVRSVMMADSTIGALPVREVYRRLDALGLGRVGQPAARPAPKPAPAPEHKARKAPPVASRATRPAPAKAAATGDAGETKVSPKKKFLAAMLQRLKES